MKLLPTNYLSFLPRNLKVLVESIDKKCLQKVRYKIELIVTGIHHGINWIPNLGASKIGSFIRIYILIPLTEINYLILWLFNKIK